MSSRRNKTPFQRAVANIVGTIVGLGGGGYFAYLQAKSGETDKKAWAFAGFLLLIGIYSLSRFILSLGYPTYAKKVIKSISLGAILIAMGAGSIWAFGNPLQSKIGFLALGIPVGLLLIVLTLIRRRPEDLDMEELEEAEATEAVEEAAVVEETAAVEEISEEDAQTAALEAAEDAEEAAIAAAVAAAAVETELVEETAEVVEETVETAEETVETVEETVETVEETVEAVEETAEVVEETAEAVEEAAEAAEETAETVEEAAEAVEETVEVVEEAVEAE